MAVFPHDEVVDGRAAAEGEGDDSWISSAPIHVYPASVSAGFDRADLARINWGEKLLRRDTVDWKDNSVPDIAERRLTNSARPYFRDVSETSCSTAVREPFARGKQAAAGDIDVSTW